MPGRRGWCCGRLRARAPQRRRAARRACRGRGAGRTARRSARSAPGRSRPPAPAPVWRHARRASPRRGRSRLLLEQVAEVDRALLAGRVRSGAERQHRPTGDRRLDLGARVQGDDRVGLREQLGERVGLDLLRRPLQRDPLVRRRPVEPGLARRVRADDHMGVAEARLGLARTAASQRAKIVRLVRGDVRRRAEVEDRGAAASVACLLDRREEAVEVRRADAPRSARASTPWSWSPLPPASRSRRAAGRGARAGRPCSRGCPSSRPASASAGRARGPPSPPCPRGPTACSA